MAQEFKFSSDQPRGMAGQFIPKEQAENISTDDLPSLVHKSGEMTGALKELKKEKENKELEKPLVSVSVNNPITWLMKWLRDLKKKQTTTITFRLGVPLIALPVLIAGFAAVFFGLGRVTSKEAPSPTNVPIVEISRVGILKIVREGDKETLFIILSSGEAIKLDVPKGIDLTKFEGKRILASGIFYPKDNFLDIKTIADVEILPPTPIPLPTINPTPTAMPEPTASPDETSIPEEVM